MTAQASSLLDRIQETINQRAEAQARSDAAEFRTALLDLLRRGGIRPMVAEFNIALAVVEKYVQYRAADIRKSMEDEVAKKLLDGDSFPII
jgi:hypothetical protein